MGFNCVKNAHFEERYDDGGDDGDESDKNTEARDNVEHTGKEAEGEPVFSATHGLAGGPHHVVIAGRSQAAPNELGGRGLFCSRRRRAPPATPGPRCSSTPPPDSTARAASA